MKSDKVSIMATLTLERCTPEFITSLRTRGMNSVRINSAHVTAEELKRMVSTIRRTDSEISILMDTKGAEIRTTAVESAITFAPGDEVVINYGTAPSTAGKIYVNCPGIGTCRAYGSYVLIDDGDIQLRITGVDGEGIHAQVTEGGVFDSRKTLALPGTLLPELPAVSDNDRKLIEAAREVGVDMIAHSFVRSADDVRQVRELLAGTAVKLYSKIECREAVDNLESILEVSDGLLVARGDLGTAVPVWTIPAIQHRVVLLCRRNRKPVIVSTQILQSMLNSPDPTRAEVSDVAMAVMEGADTLLLCGETAVGLYPERCVEIMRKTIDYTIESSLQCVIP